MGKRLKIISVIVGATVLSTLGISASDIVKGVDGNLVGLIPHGVSGPCREYEVLLQFGGHALCVDTYEAAPVEGCPFMDPANTLETQSNIADSSCFATSKPNALPWRFVSLTEAQQLCARAGKRLPNNDEWYRAVSGSADMTGCVVDQETGPMQSGKSTCTTPSGIHDLVGNVWEWIDAEVSDGTYQDRTLPGTGYVTLVDGDGVVTETSEVPNLDFNDDYAWTDLEGLRGMIRGGFYGSGEDAGMYAINASVPLDFKSAGVGFRCVKDVPI